MLRAWRLSLFLLASLGSAALANSVPNEAETERQLKALQAEIQAIEQRVTTQLRERESIQSELRRVESELAQKAQALAKTKAAIKEQEAALVRLTKQQNDLQGSLTAQQQAVGDELRNLWQLRQGGGLQVLLSQQDPQTIARNLRYYDTILAFRHSTLQRFQETLARLETTLETIQVTQKTLSEQQTQLQDAYSQLAALRASREQTLAALNQQVSSDRQRKAQLDADATALTTLLEEIRAALDDFDTLEGARPFADFRGKMPWPVASKPANRFGAPRSNGLNWQGWLLPATEGATVNAVHHGRVVYSNWLRGQGLLLILEHGDGWLTLYGHNHTLLRDVGEWVKPGDPIATAGSSGGRATSGLYFEIRKNGKPVDPGPWLKG
jgi:septal ring factor EnvC (AmiA/AmiB activator)